MRDTCHKLRVGPGGALRPPSISLLFSCHGAGRGLSLETHGAPWTWAWRSTVTLWASAPSQNLNLAARTIPAFLTDLSFVVKIPLVWEAPLHCVSLRQLLTLILMRCLNSCHLC